MLSIKIHAPQSGMIRKGHFSAVLSPVKLAGDILLHDDKGIFALAKAETCRKHEGDEYRTAGVTSVERDGNYKGRPYLADLQIIQQMAQDNKPPAGDVAFMVRRGKGWADITPRAALIKALCREQAAGTDPELATVAKAASEHLEGIDLQPHAQHRALDLLTDTLGDLTADEPLQPHIERMASEMARVQMTRNAYGMLKHVDPVELMKIDGECGMFSHVPRIKHTGREHLIINMLKADGYDKYRIYGCVKQGEAVFIEKYTDEYIGRVAPYQVHEFHKAEGFYFIPLTVVKRYAVPVLLKRYKLGKLFAGQRELAEIIKQEISELDPDSMAALSTKEMKTMLSKLADVTTESAGSAREQYLNSVLYLTAELNKRGEQAELPTELKAEVQRLTRLVKTEKGDGTKNGNDDPLALANILQHVKPITLHAGYVKVDDDSDGFYHGNVKYTTYKSGDEDITVDMSKVFPPHIADRMKPNGKAGKALYDLALVPAETHTAPMEKVDPPPDGAIITPMCPIPCADMADLRRHVAKHMGHGIAIEPRYSGDTITITKKGDAVTVTDGTMRDIAGTMPDACRETAQLDGDLVMIAKSGEGVTVTDLVYCDESMARLWHADRRLQLEKLFDGKEFSAMRLGKSATVRSMADLEAACDDVLYDDGSRGIIAKALTSTYEPGDAWADVRLAVQLNAIVVNHAPNAITCAIGPLEDPDDWRDTTKLKKKHYATIGTIEGKHAVKKGDVITVDALQLFSYEYSDGKRGFSWTAPVVKTCKAEGDAATVEVVESLNPHNIIEGETVKRWITKSEDERYVLAVALEPLKGDGDVDAQKDLYNAEEVRKAFFHWTEKGRKFGLMHKEILKQGDVVLCENYLAPATFKVGGETIKKGTWLQGIRVHDDTLWAKIKSGEITGVSIGGYATRTQSD